MNLDKIHSQLIDNLYKPLIFYIPESIIPETKKGMEFHAKQEHIFNKIIVIDNDGNNYELELKSNSFGLLGKNNLLDKNLFQLLEQKGQLNPFQFDVLLQKYMEQINFYVLISGWMSDNLESQIDNLDGSIISYFTLQKMAFQNHKEALQHSFLLDIVPLPKPEQVIKQVESILPSLYITKDVAIREPKTEMPAQLKSKRTKPKKQVLITNEEADRFLLETVFNVKFSK